MGCHTTACAPPRNEHGRVTPAERLQSLHETTRLALHTTAVIHTGSDDNSALAHATGELLAVLARGRDGHRPGTLTTIADQYSRAGRTPNRALSRSPSSLAQDLRTASRRIAAAGVLTGRGQEGFATTALLLALAGLITEIAAWHHHENRPHQAVPAQNAATALSDLADTERDPHTRALQKQSIEPSHPLPRYRHPGSQESSTTAGSYQDKPPQPATPAQPRRIR